MNSEIQRFWEISRMYTPLRDSLMALLNDEQLRITPGARQPHTWRPLPPNRWNRISLYPIIRNLQVRFQLSQQRLQHPQRRRQSLKAWYQQLDKQLEAALQSISDEDVATKQVNRGGFKVPLPINLDLFREALLIF